MSEGMSFEEIRGYWTAQAEEHGQSQAASWSDIHAIELEIRVISGYLSDGDRVLDVGCANGYSTAQYARAKSVNVLGIDYIPEMIRHAQARAATLGKENLRGKVAFEVGTIFDLSRFENQYDKTILTRVVINLGEWEQQREALRQCALTLKRDGILIMSEATLQGWTNMNLLRKEWELEEIPMPPFNNYIDERLVAGAVLELELCDIVNFSSTYFVGTRVLKPLMAAAQGRHELAKNPEMHWNRLFAQMPAWGDYGTQKLFIMKRR